MPTTNLQFPINSQTESEDQRAGADWRHERPSSCKFHIRAVYSTDQLQLLELDVRGHVTVVPISSGLSAQPTL